jgi:hypothetical protein
MTDPDNDKMPVSNWFWIITLIALFVVVIMWFVHPLGNMKGVVPATPTGQSSDWAPVPQGSAVPVTLPTTQKTNTTTQADSSVGAAGAASR